MHSIRTKITVLILVAILISLVSFGATGIYFTTRESNQMAARNLNLVCENRRDILNEYLNSIEQSVGMISRYAVDSLDGVALTEGGVLGASGEGAEEIPGRTDDQRKEMDRYFDQHLSLIENAFKSIANHTNGISSCYYRINPEITTKEKGFFFTKEGVSDFQKIKMTKIADYDKDDMNHVGWYYVPLRQGRPSWTEPYESAKMEDTVISYVVPLYKAGTFIGVIGMDIPFDTLVTQIQQFTDFKTGYFFLTDKSGRFVYHPDYPSGTDSREVFPTVYGSVKKMSKDPSARDVVRFEKDGAEWQLTYSSLSNAMVLVAAVRESEINAASNNLTVLFLTAGFIILAVFSFITALTTRRAIVPLTNLTVAARKLAEGDYDVKLDYENDDEVGLLTSVFNTMRGRLRSNINDLSNKAFTDELTGVKSRQAYADAEEKLDQRINDNALTEYALVLFDINDLKRVNDTKGHEAGDEYIKAACRLICKTFKHSPVYRIGGDEFVAVLEGDDYAARDELISTFERKVDDNIGTGGAVVASGIACYDPDLDKNNLSVFRRADEKMYLNKDQIKSKKR